MPSSGRCRWRYLSVHAEDMCGGLQDLAVVVLLMLIPLLAPSETGSAGFSKIAKALGLAAVKVCLLGSRDLNRLLSPMAYCAHTWGGHACPQQLSQHFACMCACWVMGLHTQLTLNRMPPGQAVTAIVGIIAGGRLIVRPAYNFIANIRNSDVFAATTLLIVLGTSVLTQLAGLSLALGAFLVRMPLLLLLGCVGEA